MKEVRREPLRPKGRTMLVSGTCCRGRADGVPACSLPDWPPASSRSKSILGRLAMILHPVRRPRPPRRRRKERTRSLPSRPPGTTAGSKRKILPLNDVHRILAGSVFGRHLLLKFGSVPDTPGNLPKVSRPRLLATATSLPSFATTLPPREYLLPGGVDPHRRTARSVANLLATNVAQMNAHGTDTINGTGGAAGAALANNAIRIFFCMRAGKWLTK